MYVTHWSEYKHQLYFRLLFQGLFIYLMIILIVHLYGLNGLHTENKQWNNRTKMRVYDCHIDCNINYWRFDCINTIFCWGMMAVQIFVKLFQFWYWKRVLRQKIIQQTHMTIVLQACVVLLLVNGLVICMQMIILSNSYVLLIVLALGPALALL